MQTVKIYNQNCILSGRKAPEDAPEGDTAHQRRVGRAVLKFFGLGLGQQVPND